MTKFICLPLSNYCCKHGCNAWKTPPKLVDECECCNTKGEVLCADCLLCASPFGFIFDILSCPIRFCIYKNKKKNKNNTVDNNVNENLNITINTRRTTSV